MHVHHVASTRHIHNRVSDEYIKAASYQEPLNNGVSRVHGCDAATDKGRMQARDDVFKVGTFRHETKVLHG